MFNVCYDVVIRKCNTPRLVTVVRKLNFSGCMLQVMEVWISKVWVGILSTLQRHLSFYSNIEVSPLSEFMVTTKTLIPIKITFLLFISNIKPDQSLLQNQIPIPFLLNLQDSPLSKSKMATL